MALLACCLAVSGRAAEAPATIVVQSTDTPPLWSPSLPDDGVGGAILRLLSANAGVAYALEYLPVKRFRQSRAPYIVGDPDILVHKRPRAVLPIGIFRSAFFFYRPHHDIHALPGIRALRGWTLGVLRGTLENPAYFLSNGLQVEESDSIESLLRMLKRGRIDVCILVDAAGQYMIKRLFPDEQDRFAAIPIPGSERPLALMIDVSQPGARAVAERYRGALRRTLESRQYARILEGLYGKGRMPPDLPRLLQRFGRAYATEQER